MKKKKIEQPEYYKAPLKKRADILQFLSDGKPSWDNRTYDGRHYWIAFNVKIHSRVNFEFEHLLEVSEIPDEKTKDPTWLEAAKETFSKEFNEEHVYEHAIEDMRDSVFDTDSYRMLWDGTSLDVDFSFEGRSSGWLCITEFEDQELWYSDDHQFKLDMLDYHVLLKLYKFVVQCKHDFARAQIVKEIEYKAAYEMAQLFEEIQTLAEITEASIGSGI